MGTEEAQEICRRRRVAPIEREIEDVQQERQDLYDRLSDDKDALEEAFLNAVQDCCYESCGGASATIHSVETMFEACANTSIPFERSQDANDDGVISLADAATVLMRLFNDQAVPAACPQLEAPPSRSMSLYSDLKQSQQPARGRVVPGRMQEVVGRSNEVQFRGKTAHASRCRCRCYE